MKIKTTQKCKFGKKGFVKCITNKKFTYCFTIKVRPLLNLWTFLGRTQIPKFKVYAYLPSNVPHLWACSLEKTLLLFISHYALFLLFICPAVWHLS